MLKCIKEKYEKQTKLHVEGKNILKSQVYIVQQDSAI
jgi:hypothetical protein